MTDHEELASLVSRLVREGHLDYETLDALLPAGSPEETFDQAQVLRTLVADMTETGCGRPTLVENRSSVAFRRTDMAADSATDSPPTGEDAEPPENRRYALERELARGGSGAVWLARDLLLKRTVALKVLLPESQASADMRNRFSFEAQTTGRLGHPGIIPVYDTGRLADGRWFYTMQMIGGRSLAEVLAGLQGGDPELERAYPLKRLLHVFSQMCLTVAFAHDHGMIHRDLKPENVLLGEYGEVYVADWGLAKLLTGSEAEHASLRSGRKTVPGAVIGTLHFMSPEQIRGDVDTLTQATDVWSLGVILFEILALRLPFESPTPVGLMFKIVSEEVPNPRSVAPPERNVPDPMAALCLEAMARSVERRTLTSRELADRVAAFLDGVEEQARRQERARELLQRARDLRDLYERLRDELRGEREALRDERESLRPSTPEGRRTELYRRQQALEEKALEAEAVYSKTVQVASQALDEWETAHVMDLLAELFWLRAQDAARARDAVGELHFRTLAEQHDSGRFTDRLASSGTLTVRFDAPGGTIRILRQVPYGPLLEVVEVAWCAGEERVPVGSYVVEAQAPDRLPVRLPVLVEGNQFIAVTLDPPAAFEGHEEFVYVPACEAVIGGDDGAARSLPEQRVRVEPFLIGKHPVTLAAYFRFLDALAAGDPEAARARAPRSSDGTVMYVEFNETDRRFSVPAADRDGDAWEPTWPALMLDWHDASAYCRWRSEVEGVTYRLPTDEEWEVAARGVDRRIYPWGNGFDTTFCRMVDSAEGRPLPAPVGQYPRDCSPFGVRDMAGLVTEWTSTPADQAKEQYYQRGGAFTSPPQWCRAATRRSNFANWSTPTFGFRIVRSLA